MSTVDLKKYDNSWYKPGRGAIVRTLWYFLNLSVLNAYWLPFSGFKVLLLRMFGARIGKGVNIKPKVNVKYRIFFPKILQKLRPYERFLYKFPLGAQYAIRAEK